MWIIGWGVRSDSCGLLFGGVSDQCGLLFGGVSDQTQLLVGLRIAHGAIAIKGWDWELEKATFNLNR